MEKKSTAISRYKYNTHFFKAIMQNLRKGNTDYVFDNFQLEELRGYLRPGEELESIPSSEGYICVGLKRK